MEVDRREILRYLGYGREKEEVPVAALIDSCVEELSAAVDPKHLSREYQLRILPDGTIDGSCFQVKSRSLSRNLKDCSQVILFGATLGIGADLLIQKYNKLQMSRAVVMQAAAAAMIEGYCDGVCSQMRQIYEGEGLYLRPRFSPGYGDFPLKCQSELLDALEAGKRMGIKLTDSYLMMPSKSVTAVIGVSKKPYRCEVKGCEACGRTDCIYRRDP